MSEAIRIKKPQYVRITEEDWNALTPDQQVQTDLLFKAQLQNGRKATPSPAPAASVVKQTVAIPIQAQPEIVREETSDSDPLEGLLGIRRWVEPVGRISGDRLRNCIIYQLDEKKDPWYISRMTKGFVRAKAEKLDADTPDDYVWEKNPLFKMRKVRDGDSEYMVWGIERKPKNEAERKRIREKFGVTSQTIPYLAKPTCPKCKGTGEYSLSSYPGDPVYEVLSEAVECDCSYE
jgi:hypothetical protein